MLVLLGLQLQTAVWSNHSLPMTLAGGMRLLVSPLLAFLLIPLFGLVGPARQALILEAAMPTAVLTTVLATEFNAEPSFVSATVLVTTLLTPLTLTPLLALLGACHAPPNVGRLIAAARHRRLAGTARHGSGGRG
jgi:hypothetical protein